MRRLRWRYRLSTLLGLVLVLCCLLAAWRESRERERIRQELAELRVNEVDGESFHGSIRFPTGLICRGETILNFYSMRVWGTLTDGDLERAIKLAEHLPSVVGVAFADQPSQMDLALLKRFRSLKLVEMSGNVRPKDWSLLQQFPDLKELIAHNNPSIDDEQINVLIGSSIEWIDIGRTKVTDIGAECLLDNLRLKGLALRDTRISAKCFTSLARGNHLEVVDISISCDRELVLPSQSSQADLVDLPVLPSMFLRGIADGGPFLEFRRVRHACDIDRNDLPVVGDARFPEKIRWLDCSGWDFAPNVVATLCDSPRLEYVNLACHSITESEMRSLARCTSLRRLGLANTYIEDGALDGLIQMKRVEVLDLRGMRIPGAKLREVCKIPSLKRLYLTAEYDDTGVGVDDLRLILPLLSGKELYIEKAGFHRNPEVHDLLRGFPEVETHSL